MSDTSGMGHNGPKREDMLKAMAQETLDREAAELIRTRRKRNRNGYEKVGIVLEDLDHVMKMKGKPFSEIQDMLRRRVGAFAAIFPKLASMTPGLFERAETMTDDDRLQVFEHQGLMEGLNGRPDTPPPNLATPESQAWLTGYERGSRARMGAIEDAMKGNENAALKASEAARAAAPGAPTASTPEAQAVLERARADAAADKQDGTFEMSEDELAKQKARASAREGKEADQEKVDDKPKAAKPAVAKAPAAKPKPQSQKAAEKAAAAGVK